jgi:membrane fusion protein (multidrug efflux system)
MLFDHLPKEKRGLLFIVLGLLAGLLAIWLFLKVMRPVLRGVCTYVLESSDEKGNRRQNRTVSIEAATVKMGIMTKRIATVGRLKANADVTIKSEMNGRLKEITFVEGSMVQQGQPIIKFDDSDAKAELKKAEAQVMQAKADYERVSKLHEQKIGSTKDYDRSRAELAMAEGNLDAAKARFEKTAILAPFTGNIGLINVSVGAYVQAGQELVTIVDSTPMKVEFKIPEKHVHDVGVGQTIEVRIDAFKDRVFTGVVEAVDSKVESESHSISIRGSIPNDSGILKAGLFANISLIIGEQGETIMIDESAVDREGEIEFVWVVEKGKAGRRRIMTGTRENGKIEVIGGLQPGQIVVTVGQIKLGDGVRVKITNMEDPATAKEKTDSKKETAQAPEGGAQPAGTQQPEGVQSEGGAQTPQQSGTVNENKNG